MARILNIEADGTGRADDGSVIGRVVALSQRCLEWHSPEARIVTDTRALMAWELRGLYGCAVTWSPWWDITERV